MAATGVDGARELIAALEAGATQVAALMPAVVAKSAADLTALTQQNANKPSSGPPGPRNITGDYVGSWEPRPLTENATEVSISVGTDRPQARRLEYGYVGTDSLGRTYDQPPYEHHGPAVDVIDPLFQLAMAKVAEKAVRW